MVRCQAVHQGVPKGGRDYDAFSTVKYWCGEPGVGCMRSTRERFDGG